MAWQEEEEGGDIPIVLPLAVVMLSQKLALICIHFYLSLEGMIIPSRSNPQLLPPQKQTLS